MKKKCTKCNKIYHEEECKVKHFGDYVGQGTDYDNWGWEEWDDLVCPTCESPDLIDVNDK